MAATQPDAAAVATEVRAGDHPIAPGPDRVVWVLRLVVAALVVAALATPVLATLTGLRENVLVNGDEAVAALLPLEFGRGAPSVLFPGNAYQGLVEVPAYAALWWAAGADILPMRLLHQAIWLAALAVWFVVALEPGRRSGRIGPRAYWWAAVTVAGFLGVTSVVGWAVWFRVYPGYHSGALLGGLGVLVAMGAGRDGRWQLPRWLLAGGLAGLAVYAQPMHAAAVAVVLVLAVVSGAQQVRRFVVAGIGVLLGVAPLLVWNLAHDLRLLDPDAQPLPEHPEWGYPERVLGIARTTTRVLWGGESTSGALAARLAVTGCALLLVALVAIGVVALWRGPAAGRVVMLGAAAMLLGLPLLRVMSLQVDARYAVGWWPALVVLVAAGAASWAGRPPPLGRVGRGAIVVALLAHLAVVGSGASAAVRAQRELFDPVAATADLAADLRRCGVDSVWGDYWSVYPMLWASEGRLSAVVTWGPGRLREFTPSRTAPPTHVAVLLPAGMTDAVASGQLAAAGSERGAAGWVPTFDPESRVRIALEQTDVPLPPGCLGRGGLQPVPG